MQAQLDLPATGTQNGLGGAIRVRLRHQGAEMGNLGDRSELRAGSLGEEGGGDSSREPEEKWTSWEGQCKLVGLGALALERTKGSRQGSSILEVDLGDIQCPGRG